MDQKIKLLNLHKKAGDKFTASELNQIGEAIDKNTIARSNDSAKEEVSVLSDGKIIQLKDKQDGKLEFPVTHVKAVRMSDGSGLEEFIEDLGKKLEGLDGYDDTELRQAITEINERIDTLADSELIKAIEDLKIFLGSIPEGQTFQEVLDNLEKKIVAQMPTDYATQEDIKTLAYNDMQHDKAIQSLKSKVKEIRIEGETLYVSNI